MDFSIGDLGAPSWRLSEGNTPYKRSILFNQRMPRTLGIYSAYVSRVVVQMKLKGCKMPFIVTIRTLLSLIILGSGAQAMAADWSTKRSTITNISECSVQRAGKFSYLVWFNFDADISSAKDVLSSIEASPIANRLLKSEINSSIDFSIKPSSNSMTVLAYIDEDLFMNDFHKYASSRIFNQTFNHLKQSSFDFTNMGTECWFQEKSRSK